MGAPEHGPRRLRTASRVQGLPQQFFAAIVQRVLSLQSQGYDLINLGQGNPDLPTPPHIVEALCSAARESWTHRYCSPFSGLPRLKEAVASWYQSQFDVRLDPYTQVAILFGAKTGLVELPLLFCNAGDVCLIPDPAYPDYLSGAALAEAEVYPLPLLPETGFWPDFSRIPPRTAERARLLFLNYPNNPTAAVADRRQFAEAVRFADQYDVVIAHDLAYGMLTFDGRRPISFLQTPGATEVGLEISTLSKTYNMAGWRVGFAAGRADLIEAIERLQDHLFVSLFPAVQMAAVAALEGPQDCVLDLAAVYQARRDAFLEPLRKAGWTAPSSPATFYLWLPVPGGESSVAFAARVLEVAHVVVAAGVGFGAHGEGFIRISLTESEDRIREAARRLAALPL